MTVAQLRPGQKFKTEFGVKYELVALSVAAARVRTQGARTVQFRNDEGEVTAEFTRPSGTFSISLGTEVAEVLS